MSYLTSKGILPSVGLSTGLAPCCQPPHQSCIISVGHHIKFDSLLWATTSNLIPCCGPPRQIWFPAVGHGTKVGYLMCYTVHHCWFPAVGHRPKADSLLWATASKLAPCYGPPHQKLVLDCGPPHQSCFPAISYTCTLWMVSHLGPHIWPLHLIIFLLLTLWAAKSGSLHNLAHGSRPLRQNSFSSVSHGLNHWEKCLFL
jgi:hypothetical protein